MSARLLIVDCDGTISKLRNPFYAVANLLSCYTTIRSYADEYLAGRITYDELISRQNPVFRRAGRKYANERGYAALGPDLFHEMLGELIGDRCVPPCMLEFLDRVRDSGYQIAMISSGWDAVISRAAQEARVEYWRANRVLFTDGEFAGTLVRVPADKITDFQSAVHAFDVDYPAVSYLGDSEFDLVGMEFIHNKGGDCFVLEESDHVHGTRFPQYVMRFTSLADMGEYLHQKSRSAAGCYRENQGQPGMTVP